MMTVIQFESTVEGNLIRIPDEYADQIPAKVAVTLFNEGPPSLKLERFENRQMHRAAFEEFFTAMAEIDDEPITDEFEAIVSKRINITRELDL